MSARLRPVELGLLLPVVVLLAAATALLSYAPDAPGEELDLTVVAIFGLLLLAVHLVLSLRLGSADQALFPLAAVLTALGLVAVARLEPTLGNRQLLWAALGGSALAAAALALPSIEWLARYRYTWLAVGLALIGATLVFGVDPNASGMRLWLGFGGVHFQPSEILKILAVIAVASYLAEKRALIVQAPLRFGLLRLPPLAYLIPLLFMWVISMLLLIWQRDLGAALLFYLVFLALLYTATGRRYVWFGLFMLGVGAVLAFLLFDHVQLRVRIWLDPWPTAADEGFQMVQALSAFAAGGVIGTGLGFGYPTYVPAVHTDFVLAALGEELGLIGTLAVVALYQLLVFRALLIALRARTDFAMLLATGLGATLGLQALVILAANLRIIPITGITLPFLSYGGSSILANYLMLGLLLRISAETPAPNG